jgi:hypothetical protein
LWKANAQQQDEFFWDESLKRRCSGFDSLLDANPIFDSLLDANPIFDSLLDANPIFCTPGTLDPSLGYYHYRPKFGNVSVKKLSMWGNLSHNLPSYERKDFI